jgi:hypothetical protein
MDALDIITCLLSIAAAIVSLLHPVDGRRDNDSA